MGLLGLTEVALTVLLRFILLTGWPVWTEIRLTDLLGGTLLLMGFPWWTQPVQKTLKMDLLKQTELRTGAMQDNVGKSSEFKLKSVEYTDLPNFPTSRLD